MNDLVMLLIGIGMGFMIDRIILFVFKKPVVKNLTSNEPIVPNEKRHNEKPR